MDKTDNCFTGVKQHAGKKLLSVYNCAGRRQSGCS